MNSNRQPLPVKKLVFFLAFDMAAAVKVARAAQLNTANFVFIGSVDRLRKNVADGQTCIVCEGFYNRDDAQEIMSIARAKRVHIVPEKNFISNYQTGGRSWI